MTWQLAETFLEAQLGAGAAADWLRAALAEVRAEAAAPGEDARPRPGTAESLARHFSGAARRLGRVTVSVDEDAASGRQVKLAREGLPLSAGSWTADERGRRTFSCKSRRRSSI